MARMTQEERYMREAIRLAKKAAALKEVPIGCVIVYDGKIIGRLTRTNERMEKTQKFEMSGIRCAINDGIKTEINEGM